jgi:hypothetical protein
MDEQAFTLLWEAIEAVGVLPEAKLDARNRGKAYFAQRPFDAIDARLWAEGLRRDAPHLFPRPTAPQAATTPAAAPARARKPQDRLLLEAELHSLEGLSPTQRLTKFRALQQGPLPETS